jgi:hypothetical protein
LAGRQLVRGRIVIAVPDTLDLVPDLPTYRMARRFVSHSERRPAVDQDISLSKQNAAARRPIIPDFAGSHPPVDGANFHATQ